MVNASYSILTISDIICAEVIGEPAAGQPVSYLLTDSRQIRFAGHSLFFALIGPRHDGHFFLQQAYEKGVRSFVVSRVPKVWSNGDAVFLLVPDTLAALQALCRFHRLQFDLPVIGITGSNGKTTVKEWLFQLLQDDFYILRNPRSYNSQVGVPLSVWPLQFTHELGIFEAGISQVGEMEKLASIIRPTIGLLTNIGSAHDAGFVNRKEKLEEKLKLFQHAEIIIYQSGIEMIDQAIAPLGRSTFSWSFTENADLRILRVNRQEGRSQISAQFQGQEQNIEIPFSNAAAIENAIHCWAVGLYLKRDPKELARRFAQLTPIAMRLELQEGRNGCTLINDSYNSDLQSLSIALDFAQQQRGDSRLSLILSDILQSDTPSDQLYRKVADLIRQHRIDRLIGVGEKIIQLDRYLPPAFDRHFFSDTAELVLTIEQFSFHQETILIKGARPFAFETVAQRLLPHTHRTVLEVNLSAIAHNLRAFNTLLEPGTRIMAMVKAAAYGSGSSEVARLLNFQGIHYLCVAYVDEGVELRQAGISLPIMVLNPEPVAFEKLLTHRLEPEIYSLPQLKALAQFSQSKAADISIHLKIDTGMHRLGFVASDLDELLTLLLEHPQLKVASVFSHLAAAELPAEDTFTHQQAQLFSTCYHRITEQLPYRPLRHLLNSAGIARFPQYQKDMVRLGIGMYGIEICTALHGLLRPVFRLRSRISQIRKVRAGESVGYGRKGRTDQSRRIATVSIGYADGLLRRAGNGRYAFRLHEKPAPTVGHICMDMCMIDVTDIPEAQEGDEILIFGEELPIEQLAEVYGTIPYEVLTSISARVKRLYIME